MYKQNNIFIIVGITHHLLAKMTNSKPQVLYT